jgi:hypothetical protein
MKNQFERKRAQAERRAKFEASLIRVGSGDESVVVTGEELNSMRDRGVRIIREGKDNPGGFALRAILEE